MKTLTYYVELQEPTLVTSLNGDPNSAVAHDYLPGSVLRGAIIGLYLQSKPDGSEAHNDLAGTSEGRRLFFDGKTRFLNGYLVIQNSRSLPTPRSWQSEKYPSKNTESVVNDRALEAQPRDTEDTEDKSAKPEPKTKPQSDRFCVIENNGNVTINKPQHTLNVHTQRDRKAGRALGADSGTVYRYDALAARQTFSAAIICADDDVKLLQELLVMQPFVILGGARSAGYGRAQFTNVQLHNQWIEAATAPFTARNITVTLVSDTIVYNEHGQASTSTGTFIAALEAALDVSGITPGRVFKSDGLVGGFNRTWGLPLPQMLMLKMGSVFELVLPITMTNTQFHDLAQNGLGERRAEGFGRLAINWQRHLTLKLIKPDARSSGQSKSSTNGAQQLLANATSDPQVARVWSFMQQRIDRASIDRQQLAAANNLIFAKLPPTSQLNRLRQRVVRELLRVEPSTKCIADFFAEIGERKAKKHYDDARVRDRSSTVWLSLTTWLQNQNSGDAYTDLRLIDATLAQAAKLVRIDPHFNERSS